MPTKKITKRVRKRCYCTNAKCGAMSMLTIGGKLRRCPECGAKMKPTARSVGGIAPQGLDHAVHIRMRPATVRALKKASPKMPWKRESLAGTINAIVEQTLKIWKIAA